MTMILNGKPFHVELTGPENAPALLYLHGGPGTGCYDFMLYQKERLGKHLRLIALDQRGVLRSEPLAENEPLALADLLDDCEALREQLGLAKWSVLGHSFGGYLALQYALAHPQAVEKLLFENPTFEFGLSVRSLLLAAAAQFEQADAEALAASCRELAAAETMSDSLLQSFLEMMGSLGERRDALYEFRPEARLFDTIVESSPLPSDYWGRAQRHSQQIFSEGRLTGESLLPRLPEIACPSLLLLGEHDNVTDEAQREAYRNRVPHGKTVLFPHSSHFIHLEEPDAFAEQVISFLQR